MAGTHLPEAVGCFLGGRCRLVVGTRHGSLRCLGRQSKRWGFPGQTPASCTEGTGEGSHGGCRGPPFLLPTALWDKHPGGGDRHGDSACPSSGPTDSSSAHHPLGAIQTPPEPEVLGGNLGEQHNGRSPARAWLSTGSFWARGRGRVRGCAAQEILILIFHPNPS